MHEPSNFCSGDVCTLPGDCSESLPVTCCSECGSGIFHLFSSGPWNDVHEPSNFCSSDMCTLPSDSQYILPAPTAMHSVDGSSKNAQNSALGGTNFTNWYPSAQGTF